jgi:hypothetical protein
MKMTPTDDLTVQFLDASGGGGAAKTVAPDDPAV